MERKKIKIGLVCTKGGHFEQLVNLSDFYEHYDHFWITNQNKQTESTLENEKKYFIYPAHFKKPWEYVPHFFKVLKILNKEKPTHILSTGSGRTSFVPFLLAKLLKVEFIYIETFSRVNNFTNFANFLKMIGHPIFVQWKGNEYKNVEYIGSIFKRNNNIDPQNFREEHIFVTLGTRSESFTRLLKSIEILIKKGVIKDRVLVQAGYTGYNSDYMETFDFCSAKEIDDLIKDAKFIITQESAGIGNKCLKYEKKFIVMPRDYKFGELPAKSDMQEDLQIKLEELGYTKIVYTTDQLELAIRNINNLKTGFQFDNTIAISKLKELVEKEC